MFNRQNRKIKRKIDKQNKEMKRRGAVSVKRAAGSNVDLQMMRTTTGRQLVEVKSTPKGSSGVKKTDSGIKIDLGGGVVESGGRVIKKSKVLDELLEELEWILLESDVSSEAVSEVMNALETEFRNVVSIKSDEDQSNPRTYPTRKAASSQQPPGGWRRYANK